MPATVTVRVINKPIRRTPVGGQLTVTPAQARALVALDRAEYLPETPKRQPRKRARKQASV